MDGNNNNDPIWVEDFPQQDAGIPPLRRHKYLGRRLLRDHGQSGHRRPRVDVERRPQRGARSRSSARTSRANTGESPPRRSASASGASPKIAVVSKSSASSATNARMARPSRRRRSIYWPMMTADGRSDGASSCSARWRYAIRSSRLQSPGFLAKCNRRCGASIRTCRSPACERMQQIYDESMAQTQFVLVILGIAASVTLLLGLVGIYGVIAYIVSQRRREVGIRMALGAQSESVQRIFVTRGLSLTAIGLVRRPDRRRGADAAAVVAAVRRESVRSAHLRRGDRRPRDWSRCSPPGCRRARRRASIRCWRCGRSRAQNLVASARKTSVLATALDLATSRISRSTDTAETAPGESAGARPPSRPSRPRRG